jgi:hypothetical protein
MDKVIHSIHEETESQRPSIYAKIENIELQVQRIAAYCKEKQRADVSGKKSLPICNNLHMRKYARMGSIHSKLQQLTTEPSLSKSENRQETRTLSILITPESGRRPSPSHSASRSHIESELAHALLVRLDQRAAMLLAVQDDALVTNLKKTKKIND